MSKLLKRIILLIALAFHVNIAVVYLHMHSFIEESMLMLFAQFGSPGIKIHGLHFAYHLRYQLSLNFFLKT